MSGTMLENARQCYENVETYERSVAEQLDKKPKTAKQTVYQQHHISNLVDRIQVREFSFLKGSPQPKTHERCLPPLGGESHSGRACAQG